MTPRFDSSRVALSGVAVALFGLLLVGCTTSASDDDPLRVSDNRTTAAMPAKTPWPHGAMVTAANPYAVDTGIRILKAGGSAVDAAIATHLVLGLVEPQSSGIGGGAFMLAYDRTNSALDVIDGRETAPAGATADMFMVDGSAMKFMEAWQSGIAIGTPGAVALYKEAHDGHGTLPWADLFAPAIELATEGFVVSARLNNLLGRIQRFSELDEHPDSAKYFYPDSEPLAVGVTRDNPAYAALLKRIAAEGPSAFYAGEVARAMAQAATRQPRPGTLAPSDLAAYRALVRKPVCGGFRDMTLCSAPPPSSGLAQIMIVNLYDELLGDADTATEEQRVRAFVDAQRLAYADRDHFVGDPKFADVPTRALIDPTYIAARAKDRFAPTQTSRHGDLTAAFGEAAARWQFGPDTTQEIGGTTHFSIIDGNGNAVSMTATVEAPFGSSRFVHGFLLNNEMTDFSRDPGDGKAPANLVQPGKRSRSSMSPTMVFDDDGELLLVNGSPGGNSIVAYVAKATLGVLAQGLTPQEAVDSPNIIARGDKVRVEIAGEEGKAAAAVLTAAGYEVQEREGENSGLHMIQVTPDGLRGAADKRREGTVRTLP